MNKIGLAWEEHCPAAYSAILLKNVGHLLLYCSMGTYAIE